MGTREPSARSSHAKDSRLLLTSADSVACESVNEKRRIEEGKRRDQRHDCPAAEGQGDYGQGQARLGVNPKLVHLDGLNLRRAWCMRSIAAALPASNPARMVLSDSARAHAHDALAHVASGDYPGEHWLRSCTVYLPSTPAPK